MHVANVPFLPNSTDKCVISQQDMAKALVLASFAHLLILLILPLFLLLQHQAGPSGDDITPCHNVQHRQPDFFIEAANHCHGVSLSEATPSRDQERLWSPW
jgi:hypothetical protein